MHRGRADWTQCGLGDACSPDELGAVFEHVERQNPSSYGHLPPQGKCTRSEIAVVFRLRVQAGQSGGARLEIKDARHRAWDEQKVDVRIARLVFLQTADAVAAHSAPPEAGRPERSGHFALPMALAALYVQDRAVGSLRWKERRGSQSGALTGVSGTHSVLLRILWVVHVVLRLRLPLLAMIPKQRHVLHRLIDGGMPGGMSPAATCVSLKAWQSHTGERATFLKRRAPER